MASSKSFRAMILPSSLSLPSIRSHSNSDSNSKSKPGSDSPPRRVLRPRSSFDLLRLHIQSQATQPVEEQQHTSSPESAAKKDHDGEPVPPGHLGQRARTWSDRFSSLLPALTPQTADDHQTSIHRKPVSSMMPVPTEAPPPPPSHTTNDSTSTSSDEGGNTTADTELHRPDSPAMSCPQYSPPGPPPPPPQETAKLLNAPPMIEIPTSSHMNPRIMPPIPPSPEPDRATFQTPDQIAHALRRNASPSRDSDELHLPERDAGGIPRGTSFAPPQRTDSLPIEGLKTRHTPPVPETRGRSFSARASFHFMENRDSPRTVPSPGNSRPVSGISESPTRRKLRRSWLLGGRSRSNSLVDGNAETKTAWVLSGDNQAEYNTTFLKNGEKVPELWNENGAILVYLYPKSTGCGPSFRVPEFTVTSSYIFNELIRSELDSPSSARSRARSFGGRARLSVEDATRIMSPPISPDHDYPPDLLRLYLPAAPPTATGQLETPGEGSPEELERLIAIRNLFAFLTGQPLVGTKFRPTTFQAFLQIANLLQEFCFSGPDGYTFGNAVNLSFDFYSDQLSLGDCRNSREQTVEALILGERMRSIELYNEAFAHATGKYSAIMDLRLPLFEQVSLHTCQRLERAHLDLVNRQHNVNEQLEQFDFPSLFAGIANSTSIPELKLVRFKVWKNSFSRMRQFVLGYYKTTFGSWPPKASNKKNPFAESGLNRLVLKVLYSDMCALYDLLVDRTNLTSRIIDQVPEISEAADKMTASALRNILSEFDRSKPPVLPPIPFDMPQMPSMTAIIDNYDTLSAKEQARFNKKVKEHHLTTVLNKAYNSDVNSLMLPFLEQYKDFETREGKGKTAHDIIDQRIGYWLFLYTVLQSLPVLVVDAPGLKFTEGVEYFLCQPPMGNPPWVEDQQVRKMWYEVTGGGGYVELSADAVMFSVEATYHRSHCWLAAKLWEESNGAAAPPLENPPLSPLEPPRHIFEDNEGTVAGPTPLSGHSTPSPPPGSPQMAIRPRNLSPARRGNSAYRSSIVMGLEPIPLEPPSVFGVHQRSSSLGPWPAGGQLGSRSVSVGNLASMNQRDSRSSSPAPGAQSGATFEDILGESKKKSAGKKKSRFF